VQYSLFVFSIKYHRDQCAYYWNYNEAEKAMNFDYFTVGQFSFTVALFVIVPVYLNHLLANSRDKRRDRRSQGVKVADAFYPELDSISNTTEDCMYIMTDEAITKHENAIRAFYPYLSWVDKFRFNRLWHRLAYLNIGRNNKISAYEQYAAGGSLTERSKIRPIVAKRIQDIIAFATR
jgi:hypothetical protein